MSGETPVELQPVERVWGKAPHFWLQALAAALTLVAFLLNLLNLSVTQQYLMLDGDRSDAPVALAVLVSPVAALMAIAWPLTIHLAKHVLTIRRTLVWLLLALLSILGWPISCFASVTHTPFEIKGDLNWP